MTTVTWTVWLGITETGAVGVPGAPLRPVAVKPHMGSPSEFLNAPPVAFPLQSAGATVEAEARPFAGGNPAWRRPPTVALLQRLSSAPTKLTVPPPLDGTTANPRSCRAVKSSVAEAEVTVPLFIKLTARLGEQGMIA